MATKAERRGAARARAEGKRIDGKRVSGETQAASLPRAFPPALAASLVFVAAGAVLVLEILAVRLLAPYVGLTLETTTSIIGAALGGIAAGAAVGGYLADRTNPRLLIVVLLLGGGMLAMLSVPAVRWLGPGARGDGDLAALGITLVALVPAAAVLSAVSPAVAHVQLHDLRSSGTVVGRLSAWATAGALVGTFGTGFVLVPVMSVTAAVLAIGGVLVVVGITLGAASRVLPAVGVLSVAIGAAVLAGLTASLDSPCDTETRYHCVIVEADPNRLGGYNLLLDDGYHSYVDLSDPTHLDYGYTRWIADAIDASNPRGAPLDVLFLGGGGLTLPRWLQATRPGSEALVLEVDGELVDFVEERLPLESSKGLRISVGDARVGMLDVDTDSVDVVVGDAFGDDAVPWHLTTAEWSEEVQRVLKPGGLYALNLIDLQPLEFAKAEAATLSDVFSDVRFVTYPGTAGTLFGGNLVMLASDRTMSRSVGSSAEGAVTEGREAVESFAEESKVLRDDFAPVDQLLTAG